MTDFSIGQFGSLTANGKVLKFEDFDKNNDGKITEEEYKTVLEETKLDAVELSTVDKDNNKEISQEEFSMWENKIAMQEEVNKLAGKIAVDFAGTNSEYINQLKEDLKSFIEEFAENNTGADAVDKFKEQLPAKYEALKTSILANDPKTIKSNVLDNVLTLLGVDSDTMKSLGKLLEKEADAFIKAYQGTNLATDLETHLTEYLTETDAEKMAADVAVYNNSIRNYGDYVDENELNEIKNAAKEFLQAAVDKGVTITLGGKNIKTTAAITSALSKYTDADALLNDMQDAINGLSTQNLKNATVEKVKADKVTAEYKQLANIKGSAYQVNAGLIDYSGIEGYFNDGKIHERGKGWSGSKDKAYEEGFKLLTSDTLKSQIRSQIEKMLQEKGVSFDKVADIFENVYNQSVQDTLNAEDMITGRGARGLSSKGHAYINIKSCVDTFITTFNTNIEKAINEINASDKDMDLIDINYSDINKNEDGSTVTDVNNNDFAKLYASGQTVTTRKHGADYYVKIAEQLVDNLKKTMLSKARAMCTANGIEFDSKVFDTMFNNAKMIAINTAVTGIDADGKSFGGVMGTTGIALGHGVAAMGTVGLVEAGTCVAGGIGYVAPEFGALAALGPYGLIAGGVAVVGTLVAGYIGSGHHSESSLNTKTLIDTFTENFKQNFSTWVETEKNGNKKV